MSLGSSVVQLIDSYVKMMVTLQLAFPCVQGGGGGGVVGVTIQCHLVTAPHGIAIHLMCVT